MEITEEMVDAAAEHILPLCLAIAGRSVPMREGARPYARSIARDALVAAMINPGTKAGTDATD